MSNQNWNDKEMFMYTKNDRWNTSIESISTQKFTKLIKSESLFKIPSKFDSDVTFSELELREINVEEPKPKIERVEIAERKSISKIVHTRSWLRDELEILKINLSEHSRDEELKKSQPLTDFQIRAKKRKPCLKSGKKIRRRFSFSKDKDLLTEIERSESTKTDTLVWSFLKRGPSLRKDLLNSRKSWLEMQTFYSSSSEIKNTQPARVTCPNCRFFITTSIKRISSMRTKLAIFALAILGLCIIPHVLYSFKDTVHLCPLCKIYLGFYPAFGFRSKQSGLICFRNKESSTSTKTAEIENDSVKMVSASSTSAKNLFVESKLRLSDRVQVNVNNIAAVARQIQRGSKANENLMAAAKNFALQEAAIENSETNLKKLKLLTTHINNQLDSLQNSSSKMELVLEQVRSMQR